MIEDRLNKLTIAKTGPGGIQDVGRIVSYSRHPTFLIERPDGTRFSWVAFLCQDVDEDCETCQGRGLILPEPRGDFSFDLTPAVCPACSK